MRTELSTVLMWIEAGSGPVFSRVITRADTNHLKRCEKQSVSIDQIVKYKIHYDM